MPGCSLLMVIAIVTPAMSLRLSSDEVQSESSDRVLITAAIWTKSVEFSRQATRPHLETTDSQAGFQIHKPSTAAYNLWEPDNEWFGQVRQDHRLAKWLSNKTGFFIESGAADGETNSNTLHFERKGWTGLLVEPHPGTFKVLQSKNRKAYLYNGALSITEDIATMYLSPEDCAGYEGDGECSTTTDVHQENSIKVQMAPLADLLAETGHSTVDFWSLDVEGAESQILKSFPFQKIEVGLMLIEMNKSEDNNKRIEDVMFGHGFQECGATQFDRIYVNPAYYKKRGLQTPSAC